MLPDSAQLAEVVMPAAREELLPRFTRVGFEIKADNSIVTEADLALDRRLRESLRERWPDIAFLSEEMDRAEQDRLLEAGGPLWCLDPLDGTSNFAASIPYFCVSLALLYEGRAVAGVIYDPVRDECFTADSGAGARFNGEPLRVEPVELELKRMVAIIDFKRLSKPLRKRLVEEMPFASQRNFGSSALDWAWLAAGRGHAYLHGGQKLWDFSVGSLLFTEAGGQACTLDGQPVFKPEIGPRSVVAARGENLFRKWRGWLKIPGGQ
jgi:myo-inositol-1(or 4)-monophosphatase